MDKHYINLTNGIEVLEKLDIPANSYSFIRLQSTVCEQKDWDRLLLDLDNDFIMNVALGNDCYVYDFGARKQTARAIYQGVEWIKYALAYCWLGSAPSPIVRGHNCDSYFYDCYKALSDRCKNKLKYYRTFFRGQIKIHGVSSLTTNDNNKEYYKNLIDVHFKG